MEGELGFKGEGNWVGGLGDGNWGLPHLINYCVDISFGHWHFKLAIILTNPMDKISI
jgi:hypothetical protein